MVLYKRKPVVFDEDPDIGDDDADIWVMRESEEVYTDYERYLARYNFYAQKRFTDAVNGKSGMTFFDANISEVALSKSQSTDGIEKLFPDVLREPVLRKVQFSDIGRIDDLVAKVYDEYKDQFFPGEQVSVLLESGEQLEGVIREKATFPELRWKEDGNVIREPFTRFFVKIRGRSEEALLDDGHIKRGRNVFTKASVRAFLKISLLRESWSGAPWLVKENLARRYRIPMIIPPHLLRSARNRDRQSSVQDSESASGSPAPATTNKATSASKPRKPKRQKIKDFDIETLASVKRSSAPETEVKYPIEDLNLRPAADRKTRPRLQFLAPPSGTKSPQSGLCMSSVGSVLEVWNTLNVQCELYVLDSFTFDDFVDAMRFSSPTVKCELLEEIHCAALKQLVNTEGEVQVDLPDLDSFDDDSQSEINEDDDDSVKSEQAESTPAVDRRRSRLSVVENASDSDQTKTPRARDQHRASELLAEYNWVDRLKARDLENGGWQTVLVGVLQQLALKDANSATCEAILVELVPLDRDATPRNVQARYTTLDVNLRIAALEMIVRLTLTTKAVRSYLDTCAEDMTETRKLKSEQQRKKKELMATLRDLEVERQAHNFDIPGAQEPTEQVMVDESLATNGNASSDNEDEEVSRDLRRGHDRATERKRKRDEEAARKERERLERAGAAKLSADQMKKYKKIMREMDAARNGIVEVEEQVALCDRDLREANCQRTITLGTDRFFNRYYWFERNGMPFGGLPNSSTASYGYANARIWVQGPDALQASFMDLSGNHAEAYRLMHGRTVPERRNVEEGQTSLSDASQWGFLERADQVDALLGWLDDRGRREKALSRELMTWREDIVAQMDKLAESGGVDTTTTADADTDTEMKDDDDDNDVHADVDEPRNLRVRTRRGNTDSQREDTSARVLAWSNGAALRELGHLHSQRPPAARGGRRAKSGGGGAGSGVGMSTAGPAKNGLRSTRSGGLRS